MPEDKNPLTERINKMAAVLAAAKQVSEDLKKEKATEGQAGTGQSGQSGSQSPS